MYASNCIYEAHVPVVLFLVVFVCMFLLAYMKHMYPLLFFVVFVCMFLLAYMYMKHMYQLCYFLLFLYACFYLHI